jgi:MYXO-CTERM domain-containing protein
VVGSVLSLLPENANSQVVNVLGTVARIENHAASPASATGWLTVVSAGANIPDQVRLSTSDGNVTSGAAVGVLVLSATNSVVLFSDDHAAVAQLNAVTYEVAQTATAQHVLIDVAPSPIGYAITTSVSSGTITVAVATGGALQTTAQGTLAFTVALDGSVTASALPAGGDAGLPGNDSGVVGGGGGVPSSGDGGVVPPGNGGSAGSGGSQMSPGAGHGCAASGQHPSEFGFAGWLLAALFAGVGARRRSASVQEQ